MAMLETDLMKLIPANDQIQMAPKDSLKQRVRRLWTAAAKKNEARANLILQAMRMAWKNKSRKCFLGAWEAMQKLARS